MKPLSDQAMERLRSTEEAPDLSGTRYRLLEKVARGGMGVVYAAQDEKLERRVALKALELPDRHGGLANRILREARVLAQLEHPGIVPVHDVGVLPDGRIFYTMKFVEGQRLDRHVAEVPALADRLRLFLRICDAVAFAHSRGVLHRDLKPGNIMVGSFGEVLVMDWGLAKILREDLSRAEPHADFDATVLHSTEAAGASGTDSTIGSVATGHGTVLGTPGFMSPEQARGDIANVDCRSDVFSLGAVLRFLCDTTAVNPASSAGTALKDKSMQAMCAKAMAAAPQDRYGSVQELAADASRYLDGQPISARRETVLDRIQRFYRRYRIAILLITAYLVMRILLLLFLKR
jgi:eukaryotic-like serine/threonine-protein kinase